MHLSYHYINQIGGGLKVKIGHHIIGACAEMGQNWIRGEGGSKIVENRPTSFMYVP